MKAKTKLKAVVASLPLLTLEHKRDAYGFAVRPQHLQRYREYSKIYKVEEEERSVRWREFLERLQEALDDAMKKASPFEDKDASGSSSGGIAESGSHSGAIKCGDFAFVSKDSNAEDGENLGAAAQTDCSERNDVETGKNQKWVQISPALRGIEQMMRHRVEKRNAKGEQEDAGRTLSLLSSIEEVQSSKGSCEEDSEDELYNMEKADVSEDLLTNVNLNVDSARKSVRHRSTSFTGCSLSWKEELESLVLGGLPMTFRGELWQAFIGVPSRRVEGYYQNLLASDFNGQDTNSTSSDSQPNNSNDGPMKCLKPEKWKVQIEKDIPRTFPGHPALDEDGRDALRRVLTAYARHNPSVGYCQAMNFFAGLLLLLMPEENAFWSLMGLIDNYFGGCYSEDMIESQVDQLIFEELVREKFPKLANHLDYLGVEVAWITGPWFLSIFMNMLPWESVLRVWDVLIFDGNRIMLFRTALALMDLYGPALVTTTDAGDAVALVQSLAGSTFDSSRLVLTACMGYQSVNKDKLKYLGDKHRPSVIEAMEERAKNSRSWKDSKGLASKLYSFKHDSDSLLVKTCSKAGWRNFQTNGDNDLGYPATTELDEYSCNPNADLDMDSVPDLKEQVVWLKVELCKLLEEKRAAVLRSEELETALMEMVKQDNRRLLSAKIEQLEEEISQLQQLLSDKHEQEHAMLQVLMRMEQEQKSAEDARLFAEQDAAAQRYAAQMIQEKYEEAMTLLGQMEKRAIMAETMLEATIQYNSGQRKAQQPHSPISLSSDHPPVPDNQVPLPEGSDKKVGLLSRPFGIGWRDRNKGKQTNVDDKATAH